MAETENAPVVKVCKFHRDHTDPDNQQPVGRLYHNPGIMSLGFLRGTNLAVGQTVKVVSKNEKKEWEGSISQGVTDNWTPFEGLAWFFDVTCKKYENDPDQEDTVIVTVTVTSTTNGSGSITAQPNPQDVP